MKDARTLNEWLQVAGYKWVDGQERMYKHEMTWVEAYDLIAQLQGEGAVKYG